MIGTVAGFQAYHAARGHVAVSILTDETATAALVRGSDFVRRGWVLTVSEDDPRVVEAAYVAAGYEVGPAGLLPAPGFWQSQDSGKVLTAVGPIEWTPKDQHAPKQDAQTPREAVAAILRGAFKSGATRFVRRA